MKKLALPVLVFAILATAVAALTKLNRDRRAARAENAALLERLSRAEAVSAAVMRIDKMYRDEKDENAALLERLTVAQAGARNCLAQFKDAVADRPRPKKKKASTVLPLPGY